jgi:hypothetical protein
VSQHRGSISPHASGPGQHAHRGVPRAGLRRSVL